MASRRKRKRERARKEREATAKPLAAWGRGGISDLTRGDCLLVRQAIREAWDVPEITCKVIVSGMVDVLQDHLAHPELDSSKRARLSIAIVRAMLDMSAADALSTRTLQERRKYLRDKSKNWKAWRQE